MNIEVRNAGSSLGASQVRDSGEGGIRVSKNRYSNMSVLEFDKDGNAKKGEKPLTKGEAMQKRYTTRMVTRYL